MILSLVASDRLTYSHYTDFVVMWGLAGTGRLIKKAVNGWYMSLKTAVLKLQAEVDLMIVDHFFLFCV